MKNKTSLLLWLLSHFYVTIPCPAAPLTLQGDNSSFNRLKQLQTEFECISLAQGLSQIVVQSILQDSHGFLWLCTVDGLNKYDGYAFTIYRNDPRNTNSLSHNFLQTICEDSAGILWIGTFQGGLNRFDPDREQFTRFRYNPADTTSLSSDIVNAIHQDQTGTLWIATENGLDKYNPATQSFSHFRHNDFNPNSLIHNNVRCLTEDRDGHLWIGTNGGGLNHFNPRSGRWIAFQHDPKNSNSVGHAFIRCLRKSRDGSLWIGTDGGGVDRLDYSNPQSPLFKHYRHNPTDPTSLSHNLINALYEDHHGFVWAGANGGGLNVLDPSSQTFLHFRHIANDNSTLSSDEVYCIYEDRSGILWIGTYTGGVNKLNRNKIQFTHIKSNPLIEQGLSNNFVWGLYEDEREVLWIGTNGGGLNAFDRNHNQWTHFRHNPNDPHSLSQDKVRNIFRDRNGQVWVTTESNGLNKFNRTTGHCARYLHDPLNSNSLSNNGIRTIYEDEKGYLWIGTFGGGLDRFDSKTDSFVHYSSDYSNPSSISSNYVRAIVRDQTGAFWIGTEGGGLNRFDRETGVFQHYRAVPGNTNSLSNDYIFTLYKEKEEILWIGTWGGGLNKFDLVRHSFTCYTVAQGLPDNVIYGIVQDNHDCLWLSTNKGLSKFNPQNESFVNFTEEDGLQSLEFNAGACLKNKKGELFFGGINGYNIFFPENIVHNFRVPPVVITSFLKFNKKADLGNAIDHIDNIDLSYKDYFFSFEFAALDYQVPMKNQYAYSMEGLDTKWISTTAGKRFASYTTLSPGTYRFKVKASNNDGIWNEQGASVRITIHPPIWKTWWFVSGSVLMVGCLIAVAIMLRVKTLLAIERVRTHIAADLHDNIGAGLTEISILGELEQRKSHDSKNIGAIIDIARTLVDSMNDMVWMIHPRRDTLYDLVVKIKDIYHELFLAKNILFTTSNLKEVENVHLPMEYRRQLYLLLKEAMNNCIKHSHCTQVSLMLTLHKKEFKFVLSDNGQGIDDGSRQEGDGLKNMRRRAALIGGELFIQSEKGAGTVILLVGKLNIRKRKMTDG